MKLFPKLISIKFKIVSRWEWFFIYLKISNLVSLEDIEDYNYTNLLNNMLSEKINYFLDNDIKPNGRQRIIDLKLDSESVANKLIQLYQEVLSK